MSQSDRARAPIAMAPALRAPRGAPEARPARAVHFAGARIAGVGSLAIAACLLACSLVCLLGSGCGSTEVAPPTESVEPAHATVDDTEPVDVCAPFEARARQLASEDSGCADDADCTCRSGLLFRDCGGAASLGTAHALDEVLRESAAARCEAPGPRCAPRACTVACVSGRCVER